MPTSPPTGPKTPTLDTVPPAASDIATSTVSAAPPEAKPHTILSLVPADPTPASTLTSKDSTKTADPGTLTVSTPEDPSKLTVTGTTGPGIDTPITTPLNPGIAVKKDPKQNAETELDATPNSVEPDPRREVKDLKDISSDWFGALIFAMGSGIKFLDNLTWRAGEKIAIDAEKKFKEDVARAQQARADYLARLERLEAKTQLEGDLSNNTQLQTEAIELAKDISDGIKDVVRNELLTDAEKTRSEEAMTALENPLEAKALQRLSEATTPTLSSISTPTPEDTASEHHIEVNETKIVDAPEPPAPAQMPPQPITQAPSLDPTAAQKSLAAFAEQPAHNTNSDLSSNQPGIPGVPFTPGHIKDRENMPTLSSLVPPNPTNADPTAATLLTPSAVTKKTASTFKSTLPSIPEEPPESPRSSPSPRL